MLNVTRPGSISSEFWLCTEQENISFIQKNNFEFEWTKFASPKGDCVENFAIFFQVTEFSVDVELEEELDLVADYRVRAAAY